ncbi:MAG TPA: molybdopterin-dependent oxidoreductase [Flavobacteriales bacterium]|jgi:hypothetical protein|nr:molybdopterin-dependent oxidoreductase [Flavobacteriales bacterium]
MSDEEREVSDKAWNRRSFLSFGALGLLGYGLYRTYHWVDTAADVDGAQGPLRSMLDLNERVNTTFKSDAHLAKEFPVEMAAKQVRANGYEGIGQPVDVAAWKLAVLAHGTTAAQEITLDRIKALPHTEIVFDFKCIEGWSQISHWGGVRLRDLAERFGLGTRNGDPNDRFRYMALSTPDNGYYVGIDMASALHPQTILAYEMNGLPLDSRHGAPLRLIIPTKYGVKNLKRIGTMAFSDERPPDYWHERGYDYDCAL